MLRRLWHSATSMTWVALVVRLGGFAILLPLVLASFSDAEVSVWLLFSAIASFQVIADFGFGPTFSREIAYGFAGHSLVETHDPSIIQPTANEDATATPNWDAIASATAAMLWLYRRIALVTLFLITTLGTWAVMGPIERIAHSHAAWIAWAVVALTQAIMLYGNAYAAFLIGANRIELQKRWEAAVSGISLLAQALVVFLGAGLLGLVLIAQLGLIVQTVVNRALALHVSDKRFGKAGYGKPNQHVIRAMWPAAWRTAIGAIMGLGVSQGMAIAMANLLVAAEAASVQLALRVMQIISQFSQVPFYTRIPKLNHFRAGGQIALLAAAAAKAMRSSLWVFVAGAIMVDLGIRQLLTQIGSQTLFPDKLFWLILIFAHFAERFGAMHIQLLLTSNKAIAHIANGVTGIMWIIGLFILFPLIGGLALPLSMLIAYAGFYAWYSALMSHSQLAGYGTWEFERRTSLAPLVVTLTYAIICLPQTCI